MRKTAKENEWPSRRAQTLSQRLQKVIEIVILGLLLSTVSFGSECRLSEPIIVNSTDLIRLKNVVFDHSPETLPLRDAGSYQIELFKTRTSGKFSDSFGIEITDGKQQSGIGFTPSSDPVHVSSASIQDGNSTIFTTAQSGFSRVRLRAQISEGRLVSLQLSWRILERHGDYLTVSSRKEMLCLKSATLARLSN